jgi:hypothetical protein
MRIVVENSLADVSRNRAVGDLDWTLRDLAANLLRVAGGAGAPAEIPAQAYALVEALEQYRQAFGNFPPGDEVAHGLATDPYLGPGHPPVQQRLEDMRAEQAVLRSAVEVAAARLLMEAGKEAAGRQKLGGSVKAMDRLRRHRRRLRLAARAAAAGRPKPATEP